MFPHPGGIFYQESCYRAKNVSKFFLPPPARVTKYDAIFARKFGAVLFRGLFREPYVDHDKFFWYPPYAPIVLLEGRNSPAGLWRVKKELSHFFRIQKTSNAISFTLKIRYPVSFPEVKQVKQHLSDGNSNTQQSKGEPIASGGEGNSLCKTKRLFRAVTGGSNRNEYAE